MGIRVKRKENWENKYPSNNTLKLNIREYRNRKEEHPLGEMDTENLGGRLRERMKRFKQEK